MYADNTTTFPLNKIARSDPYAGMQKYEETKLILMWGLLTRERSFTSFC